MLASAALLSSKSTNFFCSEVLRNGTCESRGDALRLAAVRMTKGAVTSMKYFGAVWDENVLWSCVGLSCCRVCFPSVLCGCLPRPLTFFGVFPVDVCFTFRGHSAAQCLVFALKIFQFACDASRVCLQSSHSSRGMLLHRQPCGTQLVADPLNTVSLLKMQENPLY